MNAILILWGMLPIVGVGQPLREEMFGKNLATLNLAVGWNGIYVKITKTNSKIQYYRGGNRLCHAILMKLQRIVQHYVNNKLEIINL